MRVIIPENISKLADVFAPYLVFDEEKKEYVLREDAPEEIVKAKQEYHSWFEKNMTRN